MEQKPEETGRSGRQSMSPTPTFYLTTWREQDMVARAEFVPLEDSPLQGFVLRTSCRKASDLGQFSPCQPELLERIQRHLSASGWLVIGRLGNPPTVVWQHQNRLWGKERDQSRPVQNVERPEQQTNSTSLPLRSEPDHRGDEVAKPQEEFKASRLISRTSTSRAVTFTCVWCKQEVTEQRFPSHLPLYCSNPECKKAAVRAKSRERTADWRKSHSSRPK